MAADGARRRELVFVYNANSGALSKLFDAGHKLVSPSTYPCSLCALTYGAVSMRRAWANFIRSLPHDVRFAYRDDLERERVAVPSLPALLESRDGTWITLLDRSQIAACVSLDELIARVRQVLA